MKSSISLHQLAETLGAQLYGDGHVTISSIAGMNQAQEGQLTFLSNSRYRQHLADCKASAVIIKESDLSFCKTNALVVSDPYLAYAITAQLLDTTPNCASQVSSSASISARAKLGKNVAIGPNVVIQDDVILEDNVQIGAGCVIGQGTQIGKNTRLWANVTVYHQVKIGESCLIQSGAVIGSDGFGYANDKGRWVKIPQLGSVIIGDRVEIGANTAIDRGALDDTRIADGVIIDNLCQIAHNVQIGENTAIAGATVLAGSLKIGRHCIIGGSTTINGHMEIVDGVTITGNSMIVKPISKSGMYSSGIPAQSNRDWRKTVARVMMIDEIYKRLKTLEKKLDNK